MQRTVEGATTSLTKSTSTTGGPAVKHIRRAPVGRQLDGVLPRRELAADALDSFDPISKMPPVGLNAIHDPPGKQGILPTRKLALCIFSLT
jgi:hypothetical protein